MAGQAGKAALGRGEREKCRELYRIAGARVIQGRGHAPWAARSELPPMLPTQTRSASEG